MKILPFRATAIAMAGATVLLTLSITGNLAAQDRSPIYPFDVTVGGQQATAPASPAIIFAKVPLPVAADARVDVDTEGDRIIVNLFPIDESGAPVAGAQGKVIMVPEGTGFDLDATLDKTRLEPGRYGMNIVLQSKGTARVQFTVGTAEQLAAAATAGTTGELAKTMPKDGKDIGKPPKTILKPGKAPTAGGADTPPAPGRSKLNMAGADLFGPAPEYGNSAGKASDVPSAAKPTTATDTAGQATPEETMTTLFSLIRAGKFEALKALAAADCDGDVRDICGVADSPADAQAEVKQFFGNGKVVGKARIDGDTAQVDFLFGPDQDREETMELVRTGGLWFLSQF